MRREKQSLSFFALLWEWPWVLEYVRNSYKFHSVAFSPSGGLFHSCLRIRLTGTSSGEMVLIVSHGDKDLCTISTLSSERTWNIFLLCVNVARLYVIVTFKENVNSRVKHIEPCHPAMSPASCWKGCRWRSPLPPHSDTPLLSLPSAGRSPPELRSAAPSPPVEEEIHCQPKATVGRCTGTHLSFITAFFTACKLIECSGTYARLKLWCTSVTWSLKWGLDKSFEWITDYLHGVYACRSMTIYSFVVFISHK